VPGLGPRGKRCRLGASLAGSGTASVSRSSSTAFCAAGLSGAASSKRLAGAGVSPSCRALYEAIHQCSAACRAGSRQCGSATLASWSTKRSSLASGAASTAHSPALASGCSQSASAALLASGMPPPSR